MALALILSSFVAASRIGGAAQQYVLAAHRIDPVLAPTAVFGRSPAKGATGEPTSPDMLRAMLADIEADAVFGMVDLVITGHFSLGEQVDIAAETLARIRGAADRAPVVVVDPIMGDAPNGLYVRPEVAERVAERLAPLADWITPNLWELERLVGQPIGDPAAAVRAARKFGRPALVTSAPLGDGETGVLLVESEEAVLFAHPKAAAVPNGTGDLVTASFGAGLVEGLSPAVAAERAARAAAEAVAAARDWPTADLPLVAIADRLVNPSLAVRIERL